MDRFVHTSQQQDYVSPGTETHTASARLNRQVQWLTPAVAGFSLLGFLLLMHLSSTSAPFTGLHSAISLIFTLLIWGCGIGVLRQLRRLHGMRLGLFACFLIAGATALLAMLSDPGGKAAAFTPTLLPNKPVGVGIGVNPGRVAWVRDPNAVTGNVSWDNSAGFYWDDAHNSQSVIDNMMGTTICWLAGTTSEPAAWQALFSNYNQTHGLGNVGYQPGQMVVIKVDLSNAIRRGYNGVTDDNYFLNDPAMYAYTTVGANQADVSPQALIALLRQLIQQAGVPATDIYLYDAERYWTYPYWRALFYPSYAMGTPLPDESAGPSVHESHEFDGVHFVNCLGLQGREQVIPSATQITYSCENGQVNNLPSVVTNAGSYLINFATLKKNAAGIACCNTDHFGSLCASPTPILPLAWNTTASPLDTTMGTYNCYVDFMANPDLGGKTFLYLLDGLWSGWYYSGQQSMPQKWQNPATFNNDWPKSFFASQDPVAIDSVALNFWRTECPQNDGSLNTGIGQGADDYLVEAALVSNPPSQTLYEPAGYPITGSLGVHEFWNNAVQKQYLRNLGGANGIELVSTPPSVVSVLPSAITQGQTGVVNIQLAAQGNEAAVGFSLNFNPTVLQLQASGVTLGNGDAQASFNLNTSQLASGVLGVAIMANLNPNQVQLFPGG